jgi:transposase
MAIRVRTLTDEERRSIESLAHSRTAAARQVERAKIVWWALQGQRVPDIATRLGVHEQTARDWLKRFNLEGLTGLNDRRRPGKPPTYTCEQRSEVIATALMSPLELGQPFACWTLDRLEVYLNLERGIPIKRSRIDDLLIAEGLRWRSQESWFSEKATLDPAQAPEEIPRDPDFVAKRGRSKACI